MIDPDVKLAIKYVMFGWLIALDLSLFVLLGWWLDMSLKTTPIFVLIGVFFAFTSIGAALWKMHKELNKK